MAHNTRIPPPLTPTIQSPRPHPLAVPPATLAGSTVGNDFGNIPAISAMLPAIFSRTHIRLHAENLRLATTGHPSGKIIGNIPATIPAISATVPATVT